MKIKLSFITNSSSAAYLIFIPDNYTLKEKRIKSSNEYIEFIEMEDPSKKEIDDIIDGLIKNINFLKKGTEIMVGPYGWDSIILIDILREDNLVLKMIDVDGEGASTISPTNLTELKTFISKVNDGGK